MDFLNRVSQFYSLSVAILAVAELVIAFLVIKNGSGNRRNQLFVIFVLSMLGFMVTNYLADTATNPAMATTVLRLYFMFTAIMMPSLFLFSFNFPQLVHISRFSYFLIYAYALVTLILPFTPYIVTGAIIETWGSTVIGGPLAIPYSMAGFVLMIVFLVRMIVVLTHSQGKKRQQTGFLFAGFLGFFAVNMVVNIIYPIITNSDRLAKYGGYASAFFVFCTAYAIIAHQLFDIRIVIRRAIIYTGILISVLAVYSLAILIMATLIGSQAAFDYRVIATNIIASILISVGYVLIRNWLRDVTNRFFYRKDYARDSLLNDIAHKLGDVLDMNEALDITMQGLVKTLRLNHAVTYFFQAAENGKSVIKNVRQIGYDTHAKLTMEEKDYFTVYFAARENILLIERLRTELKGGPTDKTEQAKHLFDIRNAVLKKLEALDTAIAVPLRLDHQPIGVILLGPKLSQESYENADLDLIEVVKEQVVASIQKARLYAGDQMKSEFVSIASHELLTPISAMEGYLSMILDEHIGEIDKQTRGYLEKVFTSAKRLSNLVKDMLSASRIEAGEMKIEPQQLDLRQVVQDAFDQLKFTAAAKKLELKLDKSTEILPPVWADKDRTTQVLINLIGNAIKYTPAGTVTVRTTVHRDEQLVEVDICDTGVGMSKEDRAHLFEKFYRIYSKETATTQGTGLGLYITKSIVEKMGGTIWVDSETGKGSTFAFTLPVFGAETSLT